MALVASSFFLFKYICTCIYIFSLLYFILVSVFFSDKFCTVDKIRVSIYLKDYPNLWYFNNYFQRRVNFAFPTVNNNDVMNIFKSLYETSCYSQSLARQLPQFIPFLCFFPVMRLIRQKHLLNQQNWHDNEATVCNQLGLVCPIN